MKSVPVERTPRGLLVRLSNDVLFDFDSAQLRPEAQGKLLQLAQLIKQTHPRALSIVGNADSIGTDEYNMNLSLRRAQTVDSWLLSQGGVQLADIQVAGDGFRDPVAPNTLPNGQDLQAQIGSSASSFFQPSGPSADSQVAVRVGIRHRF